MQIWNFDSLQQIDLVETEIENRCSWSMQHSSVTSVHCVWHHDTICLGYTLCLPNAMDCRYSKFDSSALLGLSCTYDRQITFWRCLVCNIMCFLNISDTILLWKVWSYVIKNGCWRGVASFNRRGLEQKESEGTDNSFRMDQRGMVLLTGNSHPSLAEEIAKHLGIQARTFCQEVDCWNQIQSRVFLFLLDI